MTNEVENEVVTTNIVELENGEKVNFGKNGKVVSSYELGEGGTATITFKAVTGQVLSFKVSDIPEAIKLEALAYGLREKIKSTLAPVKADAVAAKIVSEIQNLKDGKFVTRSQDTSAELDAFLKALAFVCSTGTVKTDNVGGSFAVPPSHIPTGVTHPEWSDLSDAKVIAEVLAFWDSLDAKTKANVKRDNPFIKTQAQLVETEVVTL